MASPIRRYHLTASEGVSTSCVTAVYLHLRMLTILTLIGSCVPFVTVSTALLPQISVNDPSAFSGRQGNTSLPTGHNI